MAALGVAVALVAGAGAGGPRVGTEEPRIERLGNGLRVVIAEDRTLPLVSVQLWYRVGSGTDPVDRPGLCHVARTLVEHRDAAALRLRAAGVRSDGHTLRDACCFASTLPPAFLEYVLKIEASRLRQATTTADALAAALAAAARDFGLTSETWRQTAERRLLAALLPELPHRHPPGLVAEALRDLEVEEVKEFLERWFVPGNATLLIIGDVSAAAALELVRAHFGPLPWVEPPRRAEWAAPPAAEVRLPEMSAERMGLDVAWLTPPARYFENAAIDVLMHRLCNPVDGPLARRLADLGCHPPHWRREGGREHGVLVLSIDVDDGASESRPARETPELATALENVVHEELVRAAEQVPAEIELNRARAQAARDLHLRRARFSDRALDVGWHEVVAGDGLLADLALEQVGGVRVSDLQEAARALSVGRRAYLPRGRPPAEAAGGVGGATATRPSPSWVQPLPARPPESLDGAAALKLLGEYARNVPALGSPPARGALVERELNNGVRITVLDAAGLQPAVVRTLVPAAVARGHVPANLLLRGSSRRGANQYRDYLSYHGLDIWQDGPGPVGGLAGRGPGALAPQLIELQAELLLYPSREAAEPQRDALPPLEPVRLLVVGDVDTSAVLAAATEAWADWVPDHAAPSPPVREAEQPRTIARWTTLTDEPMAVEVNERLAEPGADSPQRLLALACVARLLGGPDRQAWSLDATRQYTWRRSPNDFGRLTFAAHPPAEGLTQAVQAFLDRSRAIQEGRVPLAELDLAWRLARTDLWLSLDSAAAIAGWFTLSVAAPWRMPADLTLDERGAVLSETYRVVFRTISGCGPGDRGDALKQFESPPAPADSRPARPAP